MQRPTSPGELHELYRSPTQAPCQERALVLRARGIQHALRQVPGAFLLLVPVEELEPAAIELASWEQENVDWPPREPAPEATPGVIAGLVSASLLLIFFYVMQQSNGFGQDWWGAGRAHGTAIRAGEIWRAVTALFLHTGPPHLLGNVLFGAFFAFFACSSHGGGIGWLGISLAGILGNYSNAWIRDPDYYSVGASTAVFAAIGVLAGSEWRRRHRMRYGSLRRFAPLFASFLFLAYLGMGGDQVDATQRTDVLAHVTGFLWGIPMGILLTSLPTRLRQSRRAQVVAALCTLVLFTVAWGSALSA